MNKKLLADVITAINVHEEEIRYHETFESRINAIIDMLELTYPKTSFLSGINDTVCMIDYTNRVELDILVKILKRIKNGITYKTDDPSVDEFISIITSKFKEQFI